MTGTTAAIAGLGITAQGKVYGRSAPQFAAEAVRLASAEAGLQSGDIDGLLVSGGLTNALGVDLQGTLGLTSATVRETGDRPGRPGGPRLSPAVRAPRSGTQRQLPRMISKNAPSASCRIRAVPDQPANPPVPVCGTIWPNQASGSDSSPPC